MLVDMQWATFPHLQVKLVNHVMDDASDHPKDRHLSSSYENLGECYSLKAQWRELLNVYNPLN